MQVNDKVRITVDHPTGIFKSGWEGVVVFLHSKRRFDVQLTQHGGLPGGTLIGKGFGNQVMVEEGECEVIGSVEDTIYRRGSIITTGGQQHIVEQNAIGGCWVPEGKQYQFIPEANITAVDPQDEVFEWALQQDFNSVYDLMKGYQAVHGETPGLYGVIIEARNYRKFNPTPEEE